MELNGYLFILQSQEAGGRVQPLEERGYLRFELPLFEDLLWIIT